LKLSLLDPTITNFFKSLLKKIVDERRKSKGKGKRYDFLQLMLDAMEKENLEWQSEDIKEEVTDISAHLPDGEEYRNMVTHNKSN
jgi:ferredoxin-fold anticodon binding domain-containing protein